MPQCEATATKVCKECHIEKPVTKFCKAKSSAKTGVVWYKGSCNACRKASAKRRHPPAPRQVHTCACCGLESLQGFKHDPHCCKCFLRLGGRMDRGYDQRYRDKIAASPEGIQRANERARASLEKAKSFALERAGRRILNGILKVLRPERPVRINNCGYAYCNLPKDHPCCNWRTCNKVLQHTLVYYLATGDVVRAPRSLHHVNGNKLDNRMENLQLWQTSQPKGQRAYDHLLHAAEIFLKQAPQFLSEEAHEWLSEQPRASLLSPIKGDQGILSALNFEQESL